MGYLGDPTRKSRSCRHATPVQYEAFFCARRTQRCGSCSIRGLKSKRRRGRSRRAPRRRAAARETGVHAPARRWTFVVPSSASRTSRRDRSTRPTSGLAATVCVRRSPGQTTPCTVQHPSGQLPNEYRASGQPQRVGLDRRRRADPVEHVLSPRADPPVPENECSSRAIWITD